MWEWRDVRVGRVKVLAVVVDSVSKEVFLFCLGMYSWCVIVEEDGCVYVRGCLKGGDVVRG